MLRRLAKYIAPAQFARDQRGSIKMLVGLSTPFLLRASLESDRLWR